VVSVLVDPESYMGARAPATSRRDQGDLPLEDQPAGPPDAVHADDQSEKPAAGAGKAAALDGFNETRNPFNHPQLASISTLSTNPKSGRRLTRLQKRRSSKPMPPLPRTAGSSDSRSGSRQVS